ncbi:UDP-N-acetylmuramate--alanine ligase [Yoonia sp. BS5-3]|uniref:UDP-N-acetylmuramate--alanine ligase n=1 Tax=Yoonia phaeophyticola TaxID=3137369 RepID=A0ABZ2UZC3_9RHOB
MSGLGIVAGMCAAALVPFALLARIMRKGRGGLALTILSLLGAGFAVLLYAAGRPFGIDPVLAMSLALLLVLPAFSGAAAGALLGWLLRKRDDHKVY